MAQNRWTLVTGASAGMGLELARLFAKDGHGLVLVARRKDRLDQLAAELSGQHGVPVKTLGLDLAAPGAVKDLVDFTVREGVDVHTLVNNAGFGLRGAFHELDAERQDEMVRLNVGAVTSLARAFLPGMIARREGGILNLASMAAFQSGPYMAVYYATKAYVLSFSEALHEEAKDHGVKVSAFCPGPVQTEFVAIAGLEGRPRFDTAPDAASMARAGYDAYVANKAIFIPGLFNKLGIFMERLVPRSVPRSAVKKFNASK
ncbi:short-chain dehydrogenase [Terrihabitans soli]|uniref:Short-chain dehydrogenase n=1 Tax=Terrihabitans soli TaxID=708113 RepID=A0A6S6QWN3_9HYPH|nr:SDR family oxidoreductase [Terrihabitans soli]BCJ91440.1 short-chain dehydrogenase [Terrihabitans soli]